MNWLTQDQINEAAKTVDTAMDCSVKHWRQLATATFRELVWAARKFGDDLAKAESCPLCNFPCSKCPIANYTQRTECRETPYYEARRTWRWIDGFVEKATHPNYLKFHKAAQAEYRFLLKVRKWWKAQSNK